MKIHIGCGSVYLEGYRNIDLPDPKTFLASNRPDLVEKWITTDDDYFARHRDTTIETLRDGPLSQEYVCDAFGDFGNIPAQYWEVEEVLARHSFEHLSIAEAHKALDQIDAIMKPNGILRLDVPDHEETLTLFRRTGDEFYVRHLLGPRRNDHGFHMMSYSRDRLKALVEDHGFVFVSEEENIHFYPAFCLRFVKPGPRAPRDYVKLPPIPNHWKVAEVGPGNYPLERADVYIDRDITKLTPLSAMGKSTILGNLETGLPQIEDREFDFCFVSHVLEHVNNLEKCIATLNRIANRGMVIVPSAIKEGLFGGQEEAEHKYLIVKSDNGVPVFVRHNAEFMRRLKDEEVEKSTSRIWRTGPNRLPEARYLRQFFFQHESDLDVIAEWAPGKPLRAIIIEQSEIVQTGNTDSRLTHA